MLVLILLVYHFNIPNPNMILIAGLVVCSSIFGYSGGLLAGCIMLGYTLFFFSTNNDFVTFTDQNTRKVVVSLVGIVVDMLFICELKRAQRSAYRKIAGLTEELREDNRLLQELSLIDGLTGVKNRVSLRRDYDDYRYRELFVAMMDLDDFKSINDMHGHEAGDRVLTATGRNLNEIFGHDHCYRFGGDEFLILWPAGTEEAFPREARRTDRARPADRRGGEGRLLHRLRPRHGFGRAGAAQHVCPGGPEDVRGQAARPQHHRRGLMIRPLPVILSGAKRSRRILYIRRAAGANAPAARRFRYMLYASSSGE